ncbi:MAG: L,D-transpeptidase [Ktedonobacteraceae bacterium]|nr:L,D-transpeptidase [Ktedonobacteraceae bacterium]
MQQHIVSKQRIRKNIPVVSLFLLIVLLLSACNGDPQTQQKADQNKTQLDRQIAHAQSIGVPDSLLQSIINQRTQLSSTTAPLTVFSDQPATDYYSNLAQRYQLLSVQVRGLESQATQQLDYQASLDLQTFEGALAQRQGQGFVEAKIFQDQLTRDQNLLAQAQHPKDYIKISTDAQNGIQALHLMGPVNNLLTSFQQTIHQLQQSRLDTTALKQEADADLQIFRAASTAEEYQQLLDQLNTHVQQTVVISTQAIPYVGAAKLQQFSVDIDQAKQYGQNVNTFQQRLDADKTALAQAKSIGDFLKVSAQIDRDIASIQFPLYRGKASYLLQQFHNEVTSWGTAHQYHDSYNGASYHLDYEYDTQGIGSDADIAVQTAQTLDDYKGAIDLISIDTRHLHAMEADYSDKTSWNQPHTTDMQLLNHYGLMQGRVIVVSLIEQTLRLYQNGKLVNAFHVTTGQYMKPSPPGVWHIFLRQSPTKFKSSEPKGSAFWYPDTNINYAMEYHTGGYFIHDSYWRYNYGPGTNFPHADASGDTLFSGNGSHGCINMQEQQAAWMYSHTSYGDAMVIY